MIPEWLQDEFNKRVGFLEYFEKIDILLEEAAENETSISNDKGQIWSKNFPDERLPEYLASISFSKFKESWLYSLLKSGSRDLVIEWLQNGYLKDENLWLQELVKKQENSVARVFLLKGNINDYAYSFRSGYMPILDLMHQEISENNTTIFKYSLTNHFENEEIKYAKNDSEYDGRDEGESTKTSNPLEFLKNYLVECENCAPNKKMNIWERIQSDFEFMDQLLKQNFDKKICIIIEHSDILFSNDSNELEKKVLIEYILRWAVSSWMFENDHNQVILLSEQTENLSENIVAKENKIETIPIIRPAKIEERHKFLLSINATISEAVDRQNGLRIRDRFPDIKLSNKEIANDGLAKIKLIAEKSSGLNYLGLEDLLLQANHRAGSFSLDTINQIKAKILQNESAGLIELIKPKMTLEKFGGYGKTIQRLREIIDSMKRANVSKHRKRTIPMGILFLGPPGTGKTALAEAFANASGTNFVKLGNFRSMWVGQSEKNLAKALELIRSLSPVIVFMDEIDQSEGSRGESGDSGVNKRIFSKLLQFMSDTTLRGKVLWIAASNRPDLIDAALKRAGRFDMTIPFLLPDKEAREKIAKIHLGFTEMVNHESAKENEIDTSSLTEEDWEYMAKETIGFTGAEIEVVANEVVRRVIQKSKNDKPPIIVNKIDIENVLNVYSPSLDRSTYYRMMALTLMDINFTDVLSPEYVEIRKKLKNNSHLLGPDGSNVKLKELFDSIP